MINDFRSRSKITKLRQIEWLFQAIAIVIAGWFQGIIISRISILGLFGELPVEGVWFDTIKIIILVILYLVFYSILCFTSSRFLAKI
ncbi:MAG: hypothetical protein FWC15_07670, partial [Fibromonadales bacterium]|nr:hypothetical protein [Fibromonadales bacterium]